MMSLFIAAFSFISGVACKTLVRNRISLISLINHWIIYCSFPAMIFIGVLDISWYQIDGFPVLAAWCSQIACMVCVLVMRKFFHWSSNTTGALLIVSVLGNTSFLGYPIAIAFWGKAALTPAILYDQLGSFIALSIYVPVIIAIFGKEASQFNGRLIVKKIVTFPPFLALLLGIIANKTDIPSMILQLLSLLSITLIPLSLFVIGIQFTLKIKAGADRYAMMTGLFIKMVVSPVVVWGVSLCVVSHDVNVAIMQSAMPPMMTASLLAMAAGFAPQIVAPMVSLGLLLSVITLPIIYFLL